MTDAITEERRTGTPVAILCALAQFPHGRYYRELNRVQPMPDPEEMRLRDLIQDI